LRSFMKKCITVKIGAAILLGFSLSLGQVQAQEGSEATLGQRFQTFERLEGLEAREAYYKETRKAFPPDTANFTSRFSHDLFLAQLAKESLLAEKLDTYRKYQEEM